MQFCVVTAQQKTSRSAMLDLECNCMLRSLHLLPFFVFLYSEVRYSNFVLIEWIININILHLHTCHFCEQGSGVGMQSTLFAIHQQPSPAQSTTTAATTFSYVLTATTATAEGTGTTTYSNRSQSQTTASGQGDSTPEVAPLTASRDGKSSLLITVSVSGFFVCFFKEYLLFSAYSFSLL